MTTAIEYRDTIPPAPATRHDGTPFTADSAWWSALLLPDCYAEVVLLGTTATGKRANRSRMATITTTPDGEHTIHWPDDWPHPPLWITQAMERALTEWAREQVAA